MCAQVTDSLAVPVPDTISYSRADSLQLVRDSTFQSPAEMMQQGKGRLDSLIQRHDSLALAADTVRADTLRRSSLANAITISLDYVSSDSMNLSMDGRTVEMFNNAVITYGDIKLEAGYIRYEMQNSEVIAYGIPDSTGEITQNPVFTEGKDSYNAKKIRYNFKTQKGFIEEVITEQEGG